MKNQMPNLKPVKNVKIKRGKPAAKKSLLTKGKKNPEALAKFIKKEIKRSPLKTRSRFKAV